MAECMTISSRSFSYHRSSEEKRNKEILQDIWKLAENEGLLLLALGVPSTFANDPFTFMKAVAFFEDENFFLLPFGGNRASLVHSCFKPNFLEDDSGVSVSGILGSRITSPFKRVDIGHVSCITRPFE